MKKNKTYWVIVDEDGPWLMDNSPQDGVDILAVTNNLLDAENVLTRACQDIEVEDLGL